MRNNYLAPLLIAFALIVSGCGSEKTPTNLASLGAPTVRLVGHWSSNLGDHLYFSKVDEDKIGSYTLIQPEGRTFHHRYQVISESPSEQKIVATLLYASGGSGDSSYTISPDGSTLTESKVITGLQVLSEYNRTDDKVTP